MYLNKYERADAKVSRAIGSRYNVEHSSHTSAYLNAISDVLSSSEYHQDSRDARHGVFKGFLAVQGVQNVVMLSHSTDTLLLLLNFLLFLNALMHGAEESPDEDNDEHKQRRQKRHQQKNLHKAIFHGGHGQKLVVCRALIHERPAERKIAADFSAVLRTVESSSS